MAKDLTGMPEDVTIRGDNAVSGGRTITIGRQDVPGREDPVNVDTLRSKFTIDSESLSYASSRTYNLLDYGAISDDSTDIKASIDAAKTAIGANEAILDARDIGSTYYLAQSVTLPKNITLRIHRGARIRILSGQVLTVNGAVEAGNYEIFSCDSGGVLIRHDGTDSDGTNFDESNFTSTDFMSHRQGVINAQWFSGSDIGAKVNKAFAAGKHNAHVRIPAGFYSLTTPIVMHEDVGSHLVLEGASHIATTLVIPTSASIVGIDAFGSDEVHIRNLRVIEATGTRVSCCLRAGGTSSKVTDCWLGNGKYAYYISGGAGAILADTFIENADYGLFIASRHNDSAIGITGGTNTSNFRAYNVLIHSPQVWAANIENFVHLVVSVSSGTFSIGDTVTTPGGSIVILDIDSATNTWVIDRTGDIPSASDSLTGPTGSGTVVSRASNLLPNTQLRNIQIQGQAGPGGGIKCRSDDFTDIDGKWIDVNGPALVAVDSENLSLRGSLNGNAGTALSVTDSSVVVNGMASGNDPGGTDQKIDLVAFNSSVALSGCLFSSGTRVVMATDDPQVAATPGVTFHDAMVWDGVDDAVVMDIGTLYADNDTTTLEFTLHDYGDLTNGVLFSYGTDNSNSVAVMTVNGESRFVMEKGAGVYRAALPGAWKLGPYSVVFDKAAHTITVTDPDGVDTDDTSTAVGLSTFSDGDLHIGKRPNGGGDNWWNGCLSTVKLKNNAGTVVHDYNGYGGLDADWTDQTGSANGTVAGSPAETKATP